MKRWQKIVAIVAAALVVAVIVLSFVADGIITSKAKEQAQKLSQEWGRPVELDSVATKLLTGLGGRGAGVRLGPAPGEDVARVSVDRVEVKLALLRAIFSAGKSVE